MSSEDRIWREGDDRWTWAFEEEIPRYMWSQISSNCVVDILNNYEEMKQKTTEFFPVCGDLECMKHHDHMRSLRSGKDE